MRPVPAPAWPMAPGLRRQALALGVAVGVHAAVALAWGLGPLAPAAAWAGPALGAEQRVAAVATPVFWLTLPAVADPTPPMPDAPSLAAPASPPAPAVAEPGREATSPGPVLEAGLVQRGSPWELGYPDTDLGAPRVALVLSLQFDASQRVAQADAVEPAPPELVQYVSDRLVGAVIDGATPAAPGRLCLELLFDMGDSRVGWRLRLPVAPAGACAAPQAD